MLPDNLTELRHDQITELTDPLIVCGSNDELMSLAKTASKMLYADNEPPERVEKINLLVINFCTIINYSLIFNVLLPAL